MVRLTTKKEELKSLTVYSILKAYVDYCRTFWVARAGLAKANTNATLEASLYSMQSGWISYVFTRTPEVHHGSSRVLSGVIVPQRARGVFQFAFTLCTDRVDYPRP